MKKTPKAYHFSRPLLASSLLAGAFAVGFLPTTSQAEVSMNIGVVSNYLFRGVTQTDDAAAVQGGIDYVAESGFYVGTWASNVDFDGAGYELDVYLGYGMELNSGLGLDFGYSYYAYPDASPDDIDFGEIHFMVNHGPFSGGVAYTANSDNKGGLFDRGDLYYHLGLDLELPADFSLGFVAGYYDFKNDGKVDVGDANYWHVAASLGRELGSLGEVTFNLEYADIGSSDSLGSPNSDDIKVWVGWTLSF